MNRLQKTGRPAALGRLPTKQAIIAALLLAVPPAAWSAEKVKTPPAPATPDASVTTEQFQDWGITCSGTTSQRFCTLSQELRRNEDNRRLALLEVKPLGQDQATAGFTLPFGLMLAQGVTLQVDDLPPLPIQHYQWCLVQGCSVPLSLDTATLAAFKAGQTLKVSAPVVTGGVANFSFSLKGFSSAYTRLSVMAKVGRTEL